MERWRIKCLKKHVVALFPECRLKKKLWCWYRNLFKKNEFKIYYCKNHYEVDYKDFLLKYYNTAEDVYWEIVGPVKGYLKEYKIRKSDVIIDTGAYTGVFTLIAAKMTGEDGLVIAFEPDKVNYNVLLENIRRNNIKNVIALNKGLWSSNTLLKPKNANTIQAMLIPVAEYESEEQSVCSVVSLDEQLKELGIKKVDFIKMDIEGAELEAVKGAKNTLQDSNVKLAIASYHTIDDEPTYIKLEILLEKLGYSSKTEFPQHLTTYAIKKAKI